MLDKLGSLCVAEAGYCECVLGSIAGWHGAGAVMGGAYYYLVVLCVSTVLGTALGRLLV